MRVASFVGSRKLGASLIALGLAGACSSEERPPFAGNVVDISTKVPADRCSRPATGCACDNPGEIVECGEINHSFGDYLSCSQGRRLCGDDLKWSACTGEVTFTKLAASIPPPGAHTLGEGARPTSCTPDDACDPNCMAFTDTPGGLPSLDEGLCERATGLELCNERCGYAGTHSIAAYSSLPETWRKLAESCVTDDDCGFDRRCGEEETCVPWTTPNCSVGGSESACANQIDLVAGPPCSNQDGFHVQVCNRGAIAATSGTLGVAFYTDPSFVGLPVGEEDTVAGAAHVISYTLDEGPRSIQPGSCIELNAQTIDDEVVPELPADQVLGVLVNYNGAVPDECNPSNNWHVLDPKAQCSECTGLACEQQSPSTTLTGTIRDPAGKNPLPNVMVYVPSTADPLTPFVDGASRFDQCDRMYGGTHIATTITDANGKFTLTNVPSGTAFPLVIQIGRWRRQVEIPAIEDRKALDLDSTPETRDLARLPRTQRRTVDSTTSGEGDIPRMALVLSDADPLQCTLRNIGIAETEFTSYQEQGRVHLYNHNGMTLSGGIDAYDGEDALFLIPGAEGLTNYNLVLAPCDGLHPTRAGNEGGPGYDNHPRPTANEDHRENVRLYIEQFGGRLLTTHWMSLDFVHLNYPHDSQGAPHHTPLMSGFPSTTPETWIWKEPATYRPESPLLHQFGDNVTNGGNLAETETAHGGKPGPNDALRFTYQIGDETTLGKTFRTWASTTGASTEGAGTITFNSWSPHLRAVRSPGIALAYGNSEGFEPGDGDQRTNTWNGTGEPWGGDHVAMFQFDTPWNDPKPTGRVVGLEGHVAEHPTCQIVLDSDEDENCVLRTPKDCSCLTLPGDRASPTERTNKWNEACGPIADLSPQEKAFEFLLFSASQCVGTLMSPPSHPPPEPLKATSYTRHYQANCPDGRLIWRDLLWQGTVPTGTKIEFSVQAGRTRKEADDAKPILLGVAKESASDWATLGQTVDDLLNGENDDEFSEFSHLNVVIKLIPNGTVTPTLSRWQQRFDCIPNE